MLGLSLLWLIFIPSQADGDGYRLLWGETTSEYSVELKYDKGSNKIQLDFNKRGNGGHQVWEHAVGNFEAVSLAQSVLETQMNSSDVPTSVQEQVQQYLEGIKFIDSGSCRVLHFPITPITEQGLQDYIGVIEHLSRRSLSSLDANIYRTQKLFQLVTLGDEVFEVLVTLNEEGRVQAVSITKNGHSLSENQVVLSDDGVVILDRSGKELFSYMVEHEVNTVTGFDEVWLSVFTPKDSIGLSLKENFRIHTEDGQNYKAYRYKSLSNLQPEEFVQFDRAESVDSSVLSLADSLRDELGLNLILETEYSPCPSQFECSISHLLEKIYSDTILTTTLEIAERDSLKHLFHSCLLEEEVLQSFGPNTVVKNNSTESLLPKLKTCQKILSIGLSESSINSFLKSRFLSLNEDGKVFNLFKSCLLSSHRALVENCSESVRIFQEHLIGVQPSFHQNFLLETDQCLSRASSELPSQLDALIQCVNTQNEKYQKAADIEDYLALKSEMPSFIQARFGTSEMSEFLTTCTDEPCINAFIAKVYEEEVIPNLLDDYISNPDDRQRLTNRLMRGLRRQLRGEGASIDQLALSLQEFEQSILETALNQGMDELLLEERLDKVPSLYERDEVGRVQRAAENVDYTNEEIMTWMEFFNHMNIPLLTSVSETLNSYVRRAVSDNGISGGQTAMNQLMKDFYLWSSSRRNQMILSENNLYEGRELGYRLEDVAEEVDECFDNYRPTQRDVSVQGFIANCEIKRWKSLTFYKGKKFFEKEISKYFDLESIKANELMGVNQFLKRCLRDKEKSAQGLQDYKTGAMHCVTIAYIDLKQNIYKYQSIDKNLTNLAGDNEIYLNSFNCLKEKLIKHEKANNLDSDILDGVERLIDYSYTAPTTVRFMSSIFSSVGFDSIENYEVYRGNLNSYMESFSIDDSRLLIQSLDESCFANFESERVQAVRDGIIKLAGLDTLNLTTNLNESAKEVFADAIDLELVEMLLSDDYLLNEEFFQLRLAGNSPETQYVNKKMTIDFLVNTVNGISNLLKEGFYSDPDQAKTALVTFSSRLKELIEIAEANQRPFHMHDLLGILQQHALFDTLAIGFLSKHMRHKISGGLLNFRDEQIQQLDFRINDIEKLIEGDIRTEHLAMRNAINRSLRSDRNFRAAGLFSGSSDPQGRAIINLIKEKIILPQLLGGEPTVETLEELDSKIVDFFKDREHSAIFFADAAREFKNNVYLMNREKNRMGNGATAYFHRKRYTQDFLDHFDSAPERTEYIHQLTGNLFIQPFEKDYGHFKDILSEDWAADSQSAYTLMQQIAD